MKMSIAELYMSGLTYKQIAEREMLSIDAVRKVVIDSGVTPRRKGPKAGFIDPSRAVAMAVDYAEGSTLQEIGDRFGVTRERVRQILAKQGVERRHPVRREKPEGFREDTKRFVYFARAGNEFIKIGCSLSPESRLLQVGEWVPFKIELAATISGSFDLEAALHKMFAQQWSHGEWFRPSPELNHLIDDIANGRPFLISPIDSGCPRQEAISAKRRASHRVSIAMRRRYGDYNYWHHKSSWPDWMDRAMKSFSGPSAPPPSPEALAAIDRYIALLDAEAAAITTEAAA